MFLTSIDSNEISYDDNKFKFICEGEPQEIFNIVNKIFLLNLKEMSFHLINNIDSGRVKI